MDYDKCLPTFFEARMRKEPLCGGCGNFGCDLGRFEEPVGGLNFLLSLGNHLLAMNIT